jgi:hypothetical protein
MQPTVSTEKSKLQLSVGERLKLLNAGDESQEVKAILAKHIVFSDDVIPQPKKKSSR